MSADLRTALVVPSLGVPVPTGIVVTGDSCSCSCDCSASALQPWPVVVAKPDCATESRWDSKVATTSPGGNDPLGQAIALVKLLSSQIYEPLRQVESIDYFAELSARFDLHAQRGLVLQFQFPSAAPGDPQPLVTYSTRSSSSSPGFGTGWREAYCRALMGTTIQVGSGENETYGDPDPVTGYCAPPGAANNSLQSGGLSGSSSETQPDGTIFRYLTMGNVSWVSNSAGARVTVASNLMGKVEWHKDKPNCRLVNKLRLI